MRLLHFASAAEALTGQFYDVASIHVAVFHMQPKRISRAVPDLTESKGIPDQSVL